VENKDMSFEEYMSIIIEDGYIYPDGAPKKCFDCNSEKLIGVNYDLLDGWRDILEYDMKCEECNKIVGHWAYGHWQL